MLAGDQSPGIEAGDIVIVLDEKKHERFERHGANLFYTMKLSLSEALCGTRRYIQTLDKRFLDVLLLPGTLLDFDWLIDQL